MLEIFSCLLSSKDLLWKNVRSDAARDHATSINLPQLLLSANIPESTLLAIPFLMGPVRSSSSLDRRYLVRLWRHEWRIPEDQDLSRVPHYLSITAEVSLRSKRPVEVCGNGVTDTWKHTEESANALELGYTTGKKTLSHATWRAHHSGRGLNLP